MLDAYAGSTELCRVYHQAWQQWRVDDSALKTFQSAEIEGERELDLLRHQLTEIDAAKPNPDEEEELERSFQRSSNSSRLVELAGGATQMIAQGEDTLMDRFGQLQKMCRDLEKLDPELRESLEGIDRAVMELQEIDSSLVDYLEDLSTDPSELAALEERINILEGLKRKYGPSLEDVIAHRDDCAQRLDSVENRAERLEQLEQAAAESLQKAKAAGVKLNSKRKKQAPKLAKEISNHLQELVFKQAAFEVKLEAHKAPESGGLECVEFEFGPNPGEPLKPLRQIASSGEISRVMLSVKSALADQDATPLMVFDEIDANVGGEIARAVGEKMAHLGERHQVVAITHFPQVAAVAAHHFVVSKDVRDGRTCSQLVRVDSDERIEELIRMLGGGGEQVRAMAESLLF